MRNVAQSETTPALDRRSFLKCAATAGAACGLGSFAAPFVAIPSRAAPQKQDDSRFTVEAKFYQKLEKKKNIVARIICLYGFLDGSRKRHC